MHLNSERSTERRVMYCHSHHDSLQLASSAFDLFDEVHRRFEASKTLLSTLAPPLPPGGTITGDTNRSVDSVMSDSATIYRLRRPGIGDEVFETRISFQVFRLLVKLLSYRITNKCFTFALDQLVKGRTSGIFR